MRVLATDAWPDREFAQQHQIEYVSLDTLTAQSDFISLHTPLTPETENMFNAARLQQMKSGAFLINVSRGGIVDEQALWRSTKIRTLAGAAADVFLEEPCATHPLFTLANFAPTSHIAGYTDGAISNISARCVNNIITCVCRGERPENIMNSLNNEVEACHSHQYNEHLLRAEYMNTTANTTRIRWWIAGLMWLAIAINYIDWTVLSAAAPHLIDELKLDPEMMGFIMAAFLVILLLLQILAGWFADRFGQKKGLA